MKNFYIEGQGDYESYEFPYRIYALTEEGDDIDEIFAAGFLPTRMMKGLFYMARSVRIDLNCFELSSENRRILKKTAYVDVDLVPLSEFEYDYAIGKFAVDFYKIKFDKKVVSAQKIKSVFTDGFFTDVLVYRDNTREALEDPKPIGYCPVMKSKKSLNYAYPFYDLEYFKRNLGMGMILHAIRLAKDLGLRYLYLGTCYTEDSLYKTQFSGLEYFNGVKWVSDVDRLKALVRGELDDNSSVTEIIKSAL